MDETVGAAGAEVMVRLVADVDKKFQWARLIFEPGEKQRHHELGSVVER